MNCFRLLVAVVFVSMLNTGSVFAAGEAFFGFVEEPHNPRIMSMGSAGTALGGSGFAFYNPAAPAFYPPSVALGFGKLDNDINDEDINRGFFEIGYCFNPLFAAFAIQTQSDEFKYSDERGVIEGAVGTAQGTMGSFALGFRGANFAAGLTINGIHNPIATYNSYGLTGSAGALYAIIPGKFQAGVALLHLAGRNTRYLEAEKELHRDELPTTGRAGLTWMDSFAKKIPYTVSADVVYSFNYDIVMVPVGFEIRPLPAIALRGGYRVNHPTDGVTLGVGLNWNNMSYDAAFVSENYRGDISLKWEMGVTYELPSVKKDRSSPKGKAAFDTVKPVSIPVEQIPSEKSISKDSVTRDSLVNDSVVNDSIDSIKIDSTEELLEENSTDSMKDGLESNLLAPSSIPSEKERQSTDSVLINNESIPVSGGEKVEAKDSSVLEVKSSDGETAKEKSIAPTPADSISHE